jgi:hypothetical protein
MTKISNQYSLTNILTADLANSRLGINNVSPTVALDVTGAGKFSSSVTASDLIISDTYANDPLIKLATTTSGNVEVQMRTATTTYNAGIGVVTSGYDFNFFTANSTRMTITSAGNVGIGTTTPLDTYAGRTVLTINNAGAYGAFLNFGYNGTLYAAMESNTTELRISNYQNIPTIFYVNSTERLRIAANGQITTTFSLADNPLVFTNTSTSPFGPWFKWTTDPNNGTNYYWVCSAVVSSVEYVRAKLLSNGGLANYQSNNTNLSDIRTKKDIVPLGSYWNKFKAIEIVKFKYKDQSHDDYNIGVISQQVELVAPEFVDADGFGTTPEDGIPLKSIYTADLYHATIKVLQEAMAKIEELSAENTSLINRIEALENK